jgi:hypothetical protein
MLRPNDNSVDVSHAFLHHARPCRGRAAIRTHRQLLAARLQWRCRDENDGGGFGSGRASGVLDARIAIVRSVNPPATRQHFEGVTRRVAAW